MNAPERIVLFAPAAQGYLYTREAAARRGNVTYVRADVADEAIRQRDMLREALKAAARDFYGAPADRPKHVTLRAMEAALAECTPDEQAGA